MYYSNLSVHYSLDASLPVPTAQQAALDSFENGVPAAVTSTENGDVTSTSSQSTTKLTKTTTTTTTVIKDITIEERMKTLDNIPIFYNLFVNNQQDAPRVRKIVEEQFNKLLSVHHPIYINSIGTPLDLNDTGAILLGHHETAAEHVTLKALYDYCQKPEHVQKKVVYMHSKGSFTATQQNGKLRRFLTSGALSEECATMPDETCNICSSRFSPVPHPHTSGNMWLARCDYIKNLIDPELFEEAMDGLDYQGGHAFLACDGRGRYSAEHWVHSHPTVKPCDLYTDPKFTWNYDGIPVVKEFKRNLQLAPAPRFELKTYLKTNIRDCAGRGASVKFRIDEYKGLYNLAPTSDWWGYNFLQEKDDWWYVCLRSISSPRHM